MKNKIDIYVNEDYGYDITANNHSIEKQEILDNIRKAYQYHGCKNILRSRDELGIKYTAKFETFKDYNVIIPASSMQENKKMIKELNTICKLMKLKRKEIKEAKIKKVLLGACIVLAGTFVVDKAAPVVKNIAEKIVEWDNENFERELEESGAKEMQARVERIQAETAASEARNEIYKEQAREEEKAKEERELYQQYLQNKQSLDMREQARQYQDISTMSNVIPIDGYNASYEDTTEDLPYIK